MSGIRRPTLEELQNLLESADRVRDLTGETVEWRGLEHLDAVLDVDSDAYVLELYDDVDLNHADVAAGFTTKDLLGGEITKFDGVPVLFVIQTDQATGKYTEYPLAFYRVLPMEIATSKVVGS